MLDYLVAYNNIQKLVTYASYVCTCSCRIKNFLSFKHASKEDGTYIRTYIFKRKDITALTGYYSMHIISSLELLFTVLYCLI